jgi:hypothetical protein
MKTIKILFALIVGIVASNNITYSQCAFGGAQYPSTTFSNPGATFVTVNTCIYGGEYQLYSVVAGTTYDWSYCTGDGAANAAGEDLQLTLFNNTTGVALAYADDICGVAPKITWTATFTGTVRVLTNLYNCITNTTCHTLVWRGVSGGGGGGTGCNSGVSYLTYTVTCPATQVSYAGCTYAGEYNTLTLTAGTAYTFGSSVTTDFITITNSANTILTSGTQPVNFTPTASGTYRVYIHLNSACGTANACRNPWVTCSGTPPPTVGCNTGVLYSSYTPTCIGTQESYAGCTYAGEYNNLTLNAGTAYTFGSSITTDYITITNAANTILTSGTQPISYTPPTAGTYRVYIHTNSACGTFSSCRTPWVQCGTAPPPIPNDPCSGAIAITPGTYTGTTVGATADLAPACGTAADGTGGGVWYSVTGSSPCKSFTVSTCTGTTFDSQIRVFSGSCGALTCVGGSDDFCGAQSQVTWNYAPGTTYYVLVHGFGTATGPFSLTLTETGSSTITPILATLPTVTGECGANVSSAPTATSSCDGAITATTSSPTNYSAQGTYTITWNYSDAAGTTSTQTQTVIVDDITAPSPIFSTLSDINSSCAVTSLSAPFANDNCAGVIAGTHNATLPITTNTLVTWTYDDGNGNTSTQTQQVNVSDIIAPVPSLASLPTVSSVCSPVTSITPPTASDNCSGLVTGTTTTVFPITTNTTVTWSFTDVAGNISSQTQIVEVGDAIAPIPTTATLPNVTSICSPVTSIIAPTASDNCSGLITGTTSSLFPITTNTTVVWTFTDANGNSTTQNQIVEVGDNIPPLADIASLTPIVSTCAVQNITAPTATDNCSGQVTATSTATFPISTNTTITWTYTDGVGNTSSQQQDVTVNDSQAPVPTTANLFDIVSTCNPVTSLTPPTANDNCSGLVTGTTNAILPITSSSTITWTYTDGYGNTSSQTQIINIGDDLAPVPDVATLADINGICSITSLTPPTGTDNCAGVVTATTNTTLPITSNTTITWTYADLSGNTVTQTQNVVLVDNIAPIPAIASLPDLTGTCEITSLTSPEANDNCVGTILGTTSTTLPISSNTIITWVYNDGNGNTSTQTQNVVLNDNIAPVPDAISLADVTSSCSLTSLNAPTATDNCDGLITGTSNAVFPITSNTTVTWTFIDGNGNTITQDQNIIITDTEAPVPDATLNDITEVCEVNALTPPTASDACQGSIIGVSNINFPITTSTAVTWTYTDNYNNTSTQTQQVNITPLTADITINGSTVEVVNPLPNATYQWIDCDNNNSPIDGATNSTYSPTVSGNYAVIVNYLSCSTTSLCGAVQVNGLNETNWDIVIYPNPTMDNININVPEKGIITLYDLSGKILMNTSIIAGKNEIVLPDVATGNYMIEFESENYISNTRIVIQ